MGAHLGLKPDAARARQLRAPAKLRTAWNGAHGVAGVLAWPSRYCADNGREILWSWEYPDEGEPAVYWLTDEVAALFRQARG